MPIFIAILAKYLPLTPRYFYWLESDIETTIRGRPQIAILTTNSVDDPPFFSHIEPQARWKIDLKVFSTYTFFSASHTIFLWSVMTFDPDEATRDKKRVEQRIFLHFPQTARQFVHNLNRIDVMRMWNDYSENYGSAVLHFLSQVVTEFQQVEWACSGQGWVLIIIWTFSGI